MAPPTDEQQLPEGAAAAGRYGARSMVGLLALAMVAFPFFALMLAVERRWSALETFDAGAADA